MKISERDIGVVRRIIGPSVRNGVRDGVMTWDELG